MAVSAFRVAGHSHACLRQRVCGGSGPFRSIMNGRRQQHGMFVSLTEKVSLDVAACHCSVMALETDVLFHILDQPLCHLGRMRTMAAFTSIVSYSCIAGM